MGLFSDKKEIKVSTSVVRVMEDAFLPDSVRTGMNRSLFEGQEFIPNVMEELVSGLGVKAERMRKYALKSYPAGVPKLGLSSSISVADLGRAYIQGKYTNAVIEYSYFGSSNLNHVAWETLISHLKYNPDTNEIVGLSTPNRKIFLDSFQLVLPQASIDALSVDAMKLLGPGSTAGYTPERPYGNQTGTDQYSNQQQPLAGGVEERLKVTYTYTEGSGSNVVYPKVSIEIPLLATTDGGDYYQIKYKVGGNTYYWSYQKYSGTVPELDRDTEPSDAYGNFYPNIYFRYNKVTTGHSNLEQNFIASTKMCNLLGINFYDMTRQIEENPDIENLDNAFLTFAVRPNSKEPVAMKYLFEFFSRILDRSSGAEGTSNTIIDKLLSKYTGTPMSRGGQAITIKDKKFTMSLSHAGLSRFTGLSVGTPGTYTSGFAGKNSTTTYYVMENGVQVQKTKSHSVDYYWYRKQLTPTTYEEVQVNNLRMTYYVYGSHTTVGDDTDSILLVPLDEAILRDFPLAEKERLFGISMHMVFNSWYVQVTSWFQRGVFKVFMAVVAVVMIVFTYGSSLQALGTALAAGGAAASAALMTMFVGALKAIVVSVAVKLFVKEFGPEFALLVAVIAIAYGSYKSMMNNNTWAENLLSVGNSLVKETSSYYSDALNALQQEYEAFQDYAADMYQKLEESSRELMQSSYLSPYVVFGESPDNFFTRTAHSGNIGVQSIEAVSNYVDVALRLPTFDQTINHRS